MNSVDIEDAQLWSVTVVGNFLNSIRKIPAHVTPSYCARTHSLTPLYESVNKMERADFIRIVLDCISEDSAGPVQIKKQVVLNTLGEYEAAAHACGEYLNRSTLVPDTDTNGEVSSLNGYNSAIYTKNANFVREFPTTFESLLQSNLQQTWSGLNFKVETNQPISHRAKL